MRGADLALKEKNGMAGGKKIEFVKVSSDATPDKAVNATRKAVEQDKVQIMIGPLSGDEGIAVKNYAKTKPDITFINGSSGAQATTLARPGAELLPLQHRRRAVDGRPRRARARQGLQEGLPGRRGLRLPVLAGAGLHGELLRQGRQGRRQGLGAARHQGLRVGDRQDPEGRRRAASSCSAAPTRSTSSTSTSRPAATSR